MDFVSTLVALVVLVTFAEVPKTVIDAEKARISNVLRVGVAKDLSVRACRACLTLPS